MKSTIFMYYLNKIKTINTQYYARLLQYLKDSVKNKRPYLANNKVINIMTMYTAIKKDSSPKEVVP